MIAIDEETYDTPPFKGTPTPTWTPEIGRVLTAVLDGGAKVAGFDIVFANSIEQSEIPFGDDILGAKLRGFDRPFLRSLRAGAAAGKVVLGEALRSDGAIVPSPGQRIAVAPATEHPAAQRLLRSRRRGAARAADLCRQGEADPVDGAGTGLARAGGRAGVRRGRQRDARRLSQFRQR